MQLALLALLIVALALLIWRAVTRERRDYARFKRLRSSTARRKVLGRWIIESWLLLGGLAAVLLLAAWQFASPAVRDAREWGPLAGIPYHSGEFAGLLIGFAVAAVVVLVVPILLLRRLDEIPAVGDVRALLPRNRDELPYGFGLGVTAGVVEELLFRVALPAVIFGIVGSGPIAFGVAAVLFGILHLYQGPLGMLFAFLLGLLFTALYIATGSILAPIALHVLIDLRSLVLIPIVMGGAWAPATPPVAATRVSEPPRA